MSTTGSALPRARDVAAQLMALPKRDAESLRRIRRSISKQVAAERPGTVLDWAVELLRSGAPGGHVIAYEVVLHHPTALSTVGAADVERLGSTMQSWGEVDTFACCISGRAWRLGRIPDQVIARWAESTDRWWRRAALVSTVPLNVRAQGGEGDARRTLAVCELLVSDSDPMVVSAMSWALRALAVRERDPVIRFLGRHQDGLARRVVREVTSKLATGRKRKRRPIV